MATKLERRIAQLEQQISAAPPDTERDRARAIWQGCAYLGVTVPEPEAGMTVAGWLEGLTDEALWTLEAWHEISDTLAAECKALEAAGATREAIQAHGKAAVQRRIAERYAPGPMVLRWRRAHP